MYIAYKINLRKQTSKNILPIIDSFIKFINRYCNQTMSNYFNQRTKEKLKFFFSFSKEKKDI